MKALNERAHWEVMRGTPEEASEYCKKDDTYTGGLRYEYGELPKRKAVPKAPERLARAVEELDGLKVSYRRPRDISSLSLLQPGFIPAMKELHRDILGPFRPNLRIVTLIGPPGCGKSWSINKYFPEHGRCITGNNGVWFQQADSEVMVFEEFCGQIRIQSMLQYLDPYKMALEVKGGFAPAMYTLVIITSNTPPVGWYQQRTQDTDGPMDAFVQKRQSTLEALYDRLGYQIGAFRPVRHCGIYLEAPVGAAVEDLRGWFDDRMKEVRALYDELNDTEEAHLSPLSRTDTNLHEVSP